MSFKGILINGNVIAAIMDVIPCREKKLKFR